MSDNDRMDRAKRIRQMREGKRDEEDGDEVTEESRGDEDVPEESRGDESATEGPSSAEDDSAGDGPTTTEEMAAQAVENVSSTTASVPSTEEMEAAMEQTMEQAETVETDEDSGEAAGGPAGIAEEAASREAETRVLEFTLAGELYCLDIEYIEEIVKHETITRVPNTPEFVEGVVDLRGQITTILNPKVAIGKDDQTPGDLIVVFDDEAFEDQGAIGWVVDDVRQVSPVSDDQVNDPPMGEDYINGVIDRDGDEEFVIWTTPDLALDEAE